MTIEIEKKLDKIGDKLDVLLQWKASFEARCFAHIEKTDEVRFTLYGENGQDGLKMQVASLIQSSKAHSRWADFGMGVLRVVVATAIVAIGGLILIVYSGNQNSV